ncbi:unnamed protein product [Didymodactylos carnosus]|uniref:Uncharacterized protein n=1 Tax=Didymodactylos carnosus TaxID=1234261 RepID=A0A813STC5_9BILA|nr:unnamed protein product [Didymodactylos carnosus]CAF0907132.1 unnamed protein product [Didymodactylos carnosus]CAF3586590.1 unnamed protein product [Didymodactylos carnosus]CAF3686793.1 unnamed protein product [Didymodactylos carnosus]
MLLLFRINNLLTMLNLGKQKDVHRSKSSPVESCFSFCGLVISIGMLGGLAGLIYGIVKPNVTALISGSVVLGVAIALTVIIIIFVFCIQKKDASDQLLSSSSRVHNLRSEHSHVHHQQQHNYKPRPSRQGPPSQQQREKLSISTVGVGLTMDKKYSADIHSMKGVPGTRTSLQESNHHQRSLQLKTTSFVSY